MIVTREWLKEWIEIKQDSKELCEVFNSIGLEVDSIDSFVMPDRVVVGRVLSKEVHENAEKLSVCTVDVGTTKQQIVCGAKNVAKDQYVAVALEGAVLPNGLEIKPVELRGVQSNGMICSAQELGLPKINEGIMVLDESIGKLEIGEELKNYPLLNDDVIELELTANRGDCLSVYGVARDLSVALGKDLKEFSALEEDDKLLGIGRILSVQVEDTMDSAYIYKAIEINAFKENLLMNLRLSAVDLLEEIKVDSFLNYITYSTGVLFRAYDYDFFKNNEKAVVRLKKDKNDFNIVSSDTALASQTGFSQQQDSRVKSDTKLVLVEANYIEPSYISKLAMMHKKATPDKHYYRSSRGSEPSLEFGIEFFDRLVCAEPGITPYGGLQKVSLKFEDKFVNIGLFEINNVIGYEIDKNRIVLILQGLGCEVVYKPEQDLMSIKIPPHRHDIENKQDICEEIVRVVGIDNIPSKPYNFSENRRLNSAYSEFKKRQNFRYKSASAGFYESVSYVFDDKAKMDKYDIVGIYKKRELANPITNELSTLRATLALHLIEAVSFNMKNSRKSVPLFEIGRVFNQSRAESVKIAWIFGGEQELPQVINHGKPAMIDLMSFASKISSIVGDFSLEPDVPTMKIFSPYEFANVMRHGKKIGYLARVHGQVEAEFDILPTYYCELDFSELLMEKKVATQYSKFPSSSRDLSFIVPKTMAYAQVQKCISSIKDERLVEFFPIDKYESEELDANMSLSMKFVFQDAKGTLEDEVVNSIVDTIINTLDKKLQIKLR